jgi:hypothetical protein
MRDGAPEFAPVPTDAPDEESASGECLALAATRGSDEELTSLPIVVNAVFASGEPLTAPGDGSYGE